MKLFNRKWKMNMNHVPTDDIYERLAQLDARVKILEEENVETSNCLYEIYNTIDAVDRRIDILFDECVSPMNEPASQYVPKPSAVSTGNLIDSQKFQDNVKHSEHYYDYDRNGKLNQVKNDSPNQHNIS